MKKDNFTNPVGEKIKRECDMCKVQFETWVNDFDYEEERDAKIRSNVHKYCPSCRRLKEK